MRTSRAKRLWSVSSSFGFSVGGLVVTTALGLSQACVPATNPYDSEAPADLQAKATIEGRAAFPVVEGYLRPAGGITVSLLSTSDPTVRVEVVTDVETRGAFQLGNITPGGYVLEAVANGFIATGNEIVLRPGEIRDVGTLELGLSTDTAPVGGVVVLGDGFASGASVALVRTDLDGSCPAGSGAPPAFVVESDAAGAFLFGAVPEGTYQAWVLDPNFTPTPSEVFSVVADEEVTLSPLLVQLSSAILQIDAGVGAGIVATNTRAIDVSLTSFGEMNQMRFAEDSIANATTDWTAFAESFAYTIEGSEGDRTVLVQMRNNCVTTPHFASQVLLDQTAPLFLSSTIFGREGVGQPVPPPVVLGNTEASIPVQTRAFDISGIAAVEYVVNGVSQAPVLVGPTAPFQASLVVASAPLESGEGTSMVEVRLVDVAGNISESVATNEAAVLFRVIRDLSAPGTPIPTAEDITVGAPTTFLWLDERDCPAGQDANPFVCEANIPTPVPVVSPIDGVTRLTPPVFLLRGGPDYPDFAPVVGPPFQVRVFVAGDTLFEIQARDEAGNLSPGVARITAHREDERTLFVAPPEFVLGVSAEPVRAPTGGGDVLELPPVGLVRGHTDLPLTSTGSTAFFSVRPRHGLEAASYFSYLVAQPSNVSPLGLKRSESLFPAGIRKLSIRDGEENGIQYFRSAPALGVVNGALSWLEYNPRDSVNAFTESPRPRLMLSAPDANGRFAIDPFYSVYSTDNSFEDIDGEPAPGVLRNGFTDALLVGSGAYLGDCRLNGEVRCSSVDVAWSGRFEGGPSELRSSSNRILLNGAANEIESFGAPSADVVTVDGPVVVAGRLRQNAPVENLSDYVPRRLDLEIGVPPGTVLTAVTFRQTGNGSFFPDEDILSFLPLNVAQGAAPGEFAVERIALGDDAGIGRFTREEDINGVLTEVPLDFLFGVLIPAGVQARFPTSVIGTEANFDHLGLVVRPVVEGENLPTFASTDVGDRADVTLRGQLIFAPNTDAEAARQAGVSFWELGSDGIPSIGPVTTRDLNTAPDLLATYSEERQSILASAEHAEDVISVGVGEEGARGIPAEACTLVFSPTRDMEISGVRLNGSGELDDFFLRAFMWESESDNAFGSFQPAGGFNPGFRFFASGDDAEAQNENSCVDVIQAPQVIDATSGTIAPPSIRVDTTTPGAVPGITASIPFTGDTAGLFTQLPGSPIAVTPGENVNVIMSDLDFTGDADLYVRFGLEPNYVDFDCRPYRVGSSEVCTNLVVPDGVTELHVAVDAYLAPVSVNVAVQIVAAGQGPVFLSEVVDVNEGEVLSVRTVNTSANFLVHRVFVRFDDDPTDVLNDCEGRQLNQTSSCRVLVPAGVTSAHIGVDPAVATGTETWDVEIDVIAPGSFIELARIPLGGSAPFVFSRTGGGDASLFIRELGGSPDNDNLDSLVQCDTTNTSLNNNGDCNCTVAPVTGDVVCSGRAGTSGAPTDHVFYLVGQPGAGGAFETELNVPLTGCTQSESFKGGGILRADKVYTLSIGDSNNGSGPAFLPTLDWVDSDLGGGIFMNYVSGVAHPDIDVIGVASERALFNDRLIVTNIDASAPRCSVEFITPRRAEFHHLASTDDAIFAVRSRFLPDGGTGILVETSDIVILQADAVSPVADDEATVLESMAVGVRVLDTEIVTGEPAIAGDAAPQFIAWIEADSSGVVSLKHRRIDIDAPACTVAEVNPPNDFLDVTVGLFNESLMNRIVIAGNARARPEARLYEFTAAPNCGSSLVELSRRRLTAPPIAAAFERGDLFFWDDVKPTGIRTTGGSLRHFDLREPTVLHPGGRLSTTGFDVDNGDVVLSLAPEVGLGGGLNEITSNGLVRHIPPADAERETFFFHPRYVGDSGIAAVGIETAADDTSRAVLWLFNRGGGAPAAELSAANVYLTPATIAADPLENARRPMLESDGSLLAVLGFETGSDNRLLTAFRLPTGREANASPVGTVVQIGGDVEQVFVTEDLIVLTFVNGNARAFLAQNGLVEIDIDPFDEAGESLFVRQERVIGAANGSLFVVTNPGDFFGPNSPRYFDVQLRPIESYTQGTGGPFPIFRLPSEAFVHAFSTIATNGKNVHLYDTRASPPVLWYAGLNGSNGRSDDGPNRPLTANTQRIGVSAMPRIDGDSVVYVQGQANGSRALIRFKRD